MMIGSQPTMVNQQPTILQQQIIQPQILQSQMMQSQIPSQTLSGPPIARPVNNTLRANLTPASSPPASIIMAGASNVPQLRALQNQQSHLSQQTQMSQKSQLSQPSQQSQHTQSFTPAAKSIPGPSTQASTSSAPPAMSKAAKEKEKKQAAQTAAFFGDIDKMAGDDDINDVAAMGGVNLAEESQRILGSTEQIGTQIRSCKDEYFASLGPMLTRCKTISAANGLEEPPPEVAALVSHAVQDRIKTLVEKLACIAEHRTEIVKNELQYEVTQDVKGQLRFLESIDRVERKKREDLEREVLLRAAKSRSKSEDPEQAKLKAKAKEMQRAEMEEMRQREANLTALQAIGPRKKTKADEAIPSTSSDVNMTGPSGSDGAAGTSGTSRERPAQRARVKRINYRDLLHLLEQEPSTRRSTFLYKAYLRTPSK